MRVTQGGVIGNTGKGKGTKGRWYGNTGRVMGNIGRGEGNTERWYG